MYNMENCITEGTLQRTNMLVMCVCNRYKINALALDDNKQRIK